MLNPDFNRAVRATMLGCALVLAIGTAPAAFAAEPMPLADALDALRARGIALTYSSSLVRPEMTVLELPTEGDPEVILKQMLAPHGLTVRRAPGNAWIVVRPPRADGAAPPDDADNDAVSRLDRVEIVASNYRVLATDAAAGEVLTRAEVERMPHLGNDPLRALDTLPGIAGGDFSANVNVRGGDLDETAVVVDGLPLIEPFHMKNIQEAISIIDSRAVAGMDVMTGGFTADYGDRMSGVLDIDTLHPQRDAADELGVSFITAHALVQGGGGDTDWLVSLRRGYLDILLDFLDPGGTLGPRYADAYFKSVTPVGSSSVLHAHLLAAQDTDDFEGEDNEEELTGTYGSSYGWIGLDTEWRGGVRSSLIAYVGQVEWDRHGFFDKDLNTAQIDETRDLELVGLKLDASAPLGESNLLRWGFDAKHVAADYSYDSNSVFANPFLTGGGPPIVEASNIALAPSGAQYAVYLADRIALGADLQLELGLRWDHQTYTGLADDAQVSPRVNLRWDTGRGVFKAGWGRFQQAQGPHELEVADGVTAFAPAESATQRVMSWAGPVFADATLRIEAYDKRYDDVRPYFQNLYDPVQLFPEAEPDRVMVTPDSARAWGVEVTLRDRIGPQSSWWLSYTRSAIEDRIAGVDVPRSWDQPKAMTLGFDFGGGGPWDFNFNTTWHSGWPTTGLTIVDPPGAPPPVFVPGPRNAERFAHYMTVNLRLSRQVALDASSLTWYLEVFNALARDNPCCVDGFNIVGPPGMLRAVPEEDYWLPLIPSFGVRWEF